MTNPNEYNYLALVENVLADGKDRTDRTGVGTKSLFGEQLRLNLRDGFPLLTTKKIHFKSVAHELLWMISGSTNVKDLQKHGVTIWDEWAPKADSLCRDKGELGPIYGHQWRNFGATLRPDSVFKYDGYDQLRKLMIDIKDDPYSRRHIVTAWNPNEVEQAALPPCHVLFQFYVNAGELSCHMYQRSADLFLGVPFNIASYALLTHMVAQVTGLTPGELIISFGDVHIYNNHLDQVKEQLSRVPREAPKLGLNLNRESLFDFVYEDFTLYGYNPYPAIKAEVAV